MTASEDYFSYLKGRSLTGLIYRNWWLYPRICRYLPGSVLDVGCGIGDFLRFRRDAIGVDIIPAAVDWCRTLGLDARLMEVNQLPFGDATFDGVVLDNVLEHVAEPHALVTEVVRVLKPTARVVVGVPGRKGYASDPDHKVFYDEAKLVGLLQNYGLKQKKLFHMPVEAKFLDRSLSQYCLYGVFERG